MIVLKSTADDPILEESGIGKGSRLLKINDREVCDVLDFQFLSGGDGLILLFENPDGQRIELEIDGYDLLDLEFEFEPDSPRRCTNSCVFCFIHQLPKGLRRSLYIKDEDYRLSFQHGNYVTLTNLSEADFKRIEEQRLSPLYVSVHATDDELRRRMLQNDGIPSIMAQMRRLIDAGIDLHTQIVLCPGWNDGEHLVRTIDDLAGLYPGVRSVAVVPLGLTAFRDKLPKLAPVTPEIARDVVREVSVIGDKLVGRLSSRFVYPADEFYIMSGSAIPESSFYDDFPQIEDGVGMVRQLLDSDPASDIYFDRPVHVTVATGRLIADILSDVLDEKWQGVKNLSHNLAAVDNDLLGRSVTVSGLLGGKDIIGTLVNRDSLGDVVVVPPNCLNDDGLFLDDLTLADLSARLGRTVIQASYSPAETLARIAEEMGN